MRTFIILAGLLVAWAAPVQSCQFNTDCDVGSKCLKASGQLYGVCAGGMNPGNNNDRQPVRDRMDLSGKVGNTCSYDTECGIGNICLKGRSQLSGVCMPRN
ncbi:MAG: hypothetical protein SFV21_10510 [Rhodospirillaceae bacterium]|nr:hypothetical protein [Rhodospirillaceae bacterium]